MLDVALGTNRMKKIIGPRLGASLSLIPICILSAHAAEPNSPTGANIAELRSRALGITQQGHPEQALPIYDTLTALEHIDPEVFQEAHAAAMRAHDFRRSATYGERQLSSAPNDFSAMEQIAFSHHMSGDLTNFELARDRAFKFRLSTTDTKIQSNRLLFDYFGVGNARVFSNECYRVEPPLRIKYRFDVMDPAPGAPAGQVLRGFLVLEHLEADDKAAKALTGDARPRFSLDAFEKNRTVHKTIQSYIGEPKYEMVKARVAQYLNDGAISSASTAAEGKSFKADCSAFPGQN
jgi:hypothetical protein